MSTIFLLKKTKVSFFNCMGSGDYAFYMEKTKERFGWICNGMMFQAVGDGDTVRVP